MNAPKSQFVSGWWARTGNRIYSRSPYDDTGFYGTVTFARNGDEFIMVMPDGETCSYYRHRRDVTILGNGVGEYWRETFKEEE